MIRIIICFISSQPNSFTSAIADHVALLNHGDVDVRLAAGENIAYLVELERDAAAANEEEEMFSLDDLYPEVITMSEVVEKLEDLSADRSRYQSKDKTLKQRSGFREIVKSVEVS